MAVPYRLCEGRGPPMAKLGPNSTVAVRPLQRKLHEHEPVPQFLRKLIVGLDCLEAQALIQSPCLVLANDRIQAHGSIAQCYGLIDHRICQCVADSFSMIVCVDNTT